MPILNCGAPRIFTIFWETLSKLGVTVEVRSFDGIVYTAHGIYSHDLKILPRGKKGIYTHILA